MKCPHSFNFIEWSWCCLKIHLLCSTEEQKSHKYEPAWGSVNAGGISISFLLNELSWSHIFYTLCLFLIVSHFLLIVRAQSLAVTSQTVLINTLLVICTANGAEDYGMQANELKISWSVCINDSANERYCDHILAVMTEPWTLCLAFLFCTLLHGSLEYLVMTGRMQCWAVKYYIMASNTYSWPISIAIYLF